MPNYLCDPERIEQQTFDRIRELALLDSFSEDEQQVVLHMIRECGEPLLAEKVHFSPQATEVAKKAIKKYAPLLYDCDMVGGGLKPNLLYQEPLSFYNKSAVISQAKANKQTRAMTAIDHWKPYLDKSICVIGYSSTALMRLLEVLKDKDNKKKPALIIAMPPGFVNAAEAKQQLMGAHEELGVEYILVEGCWGGGMFAASAMNALLMIQQGTYV